MLYVKMMKKILFFKKTAEFTVFSDEIIIAPYDLYELERQNIIVGPQETVSIKDDKVMYKVTLTDLAKLREQMFTSIDKN
jgi:hypothetical protein